MRRFAILLSVVAVVLVSSAIVISRPLLVAAQEATPTTPAQHPVVGAWQFDTNADDPFNPPSYAIFHGDGTYIEAHPTVGMGLGAWEATGDRTADLTIIFADLDPTEAGSARGTLTIHATVTLDASGMTLTAPYTFQGADLGGIVQFQGMLTATATRIEAAPMEPLATPAALSAATPSA
jgi:hypothetical protein